MSKKAFQTRNSVSNKKEQEPKLPPWFTCPNAMRERYGEVQYDLFPGLKVDYGPVSRDPGEEYRNGRF